MTHRSAQNQARLRRSGALVATLLSCSASVVFGQTGGTAMAALPTQSTTSALGFTGFFALPPCRVADTRSAAGVPLGAPSLAAGGSRTFSVRRLCGLPDNAAAVSFNVTVTSPTLAGDLRMFPGGSAAPLASVINYAAGQTRANNGIVPIGADGSIVVLSDQPAGVVDLILDVNGYFASTGNVTTPAGLNVRVRPAPEVELNFDDVTTAGVTTAQVLEFADNRGPRPTDQSLKSFFPAGSPEQAFVPDVIVPFYLSGLGKGGPAGTPTFVLSIIGTTAKFARTAEFHGLEDFRLGWDPPCVSLSDRTLEPRTFYAREALKGEPALVEETLFGGPVFVDISSGCGSNKGSGWNFSAYLTARDTRTPDQIATFMLQQLENALTALGQYVLSRPVAASLMNDAQSALTNLGTAPATSMANMADFLGVVDGNPAAFDNSVRNVSGEFDARAQAATYMIRKLVTPGTIVEFPVLTAAAGLGRIALGPDGNLWFTEGSTTVPTVSKIGRITRAGVVTEFPVPTANSNPYGIAAGPDGNVWFTEGGTSKIGRITPAGVVTEFPVPSGGNSRTLAITTGPDGNLWFTELTGNRIGRVLPTGAILEFPAPGQPYGIVTGPDGNLWFTEYTGNKIGVITTAGVVVKEFTVPTPSSHPYGIAVGLDGNIWFIENTGNKVGVITPAGAITEFPLPGATGPAWITSAPADGNLWFTEDTAGKIGRITPAGVVTHFAIPTPASTPYGIVVGPDGNLWFTEGAGNKIGRITP